MTLQYYNNRQASERSEMSGNFENARKIKHCEINASTKYIDLFFIHALNCTITFFFASVKHQTYIYFTLSSESLY